MPGFNRRGPEGMGPMTGGGRGFCNAPNRSSFGRGASFGRGRGRGFGYNRGAGMGGWTGYDGPNGPYFNRTEEETSLKSQAAMLKDELNAVEKRLKELEEAE